MEIKLLNGLLFKTMIENGANNLSNNYKYIDDLNVFPVPDGDTGTNMKMTINSGVQEIAELKIESMDEMSKKLSRGLLMGARGNSGVILSQLFRGLHKGFAGHEKVGPVELVAGFRGGVDQAYKSVMNPVEGTILTVAREATEHCEKLDLDNMSINEVLAEYIEEANASLERTPDLLDKLKEAGVIDSGGAGYLLIVEGMYKALNGEYIKLVAEDDIQSTKITFDASSEEFGYCTEFILLLSEVRNVEDEIKDSLAYLGDSIVVVQDEDIIKVHIHTLTPGDALNIAQKYGDFGKIKIENMALQHEEMVANETPKNNGPRKKYGVVTVAQGEGLVNMFYEFGCDKVVTGGQTMNPSTEDIVKAIGEVHADNVLVFPNNKNIMLAAEQAKELVEDKNVIVIATKTIATGYSAISMLDLNSEPEAIKADIEETIAEVHTGEVTYAIRDTQVDGVDIKENDFMGIHDGKMIVSNKDIMVTLEELVADMLTDAEIITVIYGKDVSDEALEEFTGLISKKYPDVEVDLIDGKQDVYHYIIAVE